MEQLDCQMFLFGYETRRNGRTCKSYVFPSFDGVTFSGYTLQRSFLSKKYVAIYVAVYMIRLLY